MRLYVVCIQVSLLASWNVEYGFFAGKDVNV